MPRLIAFSGFFGLPGFRKTKKKCFQSNMLSRVEIRNLKPSKKKLRSVVLEKQEFQNRDESLLKTFLALIDCRDFNAGMELILFYPNTLQKMKVCD